MSQVITVTLNPSLDRTVSVHHLAEGYRNTVSEPTILDAAGRGVNISRALHGMGEDTHALVLLGNDAVSKAYEALLAAEGFPLTLLRRKGLTRSNLIIYDTGTRAETKIIEESVSLGDDEDVVSTIQEHVQRLIKSGDTVCLSGAMPYGVAVNTYANLTRLARDAGAKVVLAADGIALEIGLKAQPNIVIVRDIELESYFNYPVRNLDDVIYSARKLSARSEGSLILVREQNTEYGLIINADSGWLAKMPDVEENGEGTSSGVKDAFIAGFLTQYRHSDDIPHALQWAMAAANFARTQTGNIFGKADDIQAMMANIEVTAVE